MKINEKIRFIRELKNWSQEEMAEKLNMSIGGYANIERGGTNIKYSRLEQIANILDLKLSNLTDLDEKNFQVTIHSSDEQLQHKLEIAQQEILYLKEKVTNLKEIIELMKRGQP